MSLVSSVSHELMDRCEIERNPISLAAVRALGEAHLMCCMQMYYALALITKGSARTLIRSVEETNGAEAWRLIHSRYAPDTQNRQYALKQKIMMPAKPWCDHTEGFGSGLRSWELDVGEWERASGTALADAVKYTVTMKMTRFFLETVCSLVHMPTAQLFVQPCCSGVTPLETLERIRPRHLEIERVQMMTGCKERTKGQNQRGNRTTSTTNTSSTDINTCTSCGKPGHWAKECWNPGGGAYDNSAYRNTGKDKSKNTGEGRTASTVSYPLQDPSVVGGLSCISGVDPWIMGVTLGSVSSIRRHAGAEYLLLDSGAQLHACPLTCPGQKIPLPDPGIHIASGARLQHDGGRLVTYKLPEGRTIRVLFHACAVQKSILSLGRLTQQEYWSDLRADTGTLIFPDKTQMKRSHTQLHKEKRIFFDKRDDGCALVDSWCE